MRDRPLLFAAVTVRAVATGMVGPLLGFYLARLGFDEATIGAIVSAGLAGAAAATALVTLRGDRLGRRNVLLDVTALGIAGGAVAALASEAWVVGVAAFVGMLNGMGRDRGACLVVEQALLPATTTPERRTLAFAWYSVLQDAGCALGALASGLPALLRREAGLGELASARVSLGGYLLLLAAAAVPYLFLSPGVATPEKSVAGALTAETRRILRRICGLFGIDSVAGGFLTSTYLAYFFLARFGVSEAAVALLFFGKSALNAASHLGAAWLARRIGLVNTMVFTHVPASLLLVTVAFAPDFATAAALFLLREGLVEMDVPTRQSYVMALVRPEERTFVSGATHLVRMAGWAVAPVLGGFAASWASLWLPLVVAAAMKIAYDFLLWFSFRRLRPPEEAGAGGPRSTE